jgi:hypothetical protein
MQHVGIERTAGPERPQETAEGVLAVRVNVFPWKHSYKFYAFAALQSASRRVGPHYAPGFQVGDDQPVRCAFKDIFVQLPVF